MLLKKSAIALLCFLTVATLLLSTCAHAHTHTRVHTHTPARRFSQSGIASTYGEGDGFNGKRTASGVRFNRNAMTLAHRHLPFGTRVKITSAKNGKSVIGRVNDRGPFVRGRIADLSTAMAKRIGLDGIGYVKLEVIK